MGAREAESAWSNMVERERGRELSERQEELSLTWWRERERVRERESLV